MRIKVLYSRLDSACATFKNAPTKILERLIVSTRREINVELEKVRREMTKIR